MKVIENGSELYGTFCNPERNLTCKGIFKLDNESSISYEIEENIVETDLEIEQKYNMNVLTTYWMNRVALFYNNVPKIQFITEDGSQKFSLYNNHLVPFITESPRTVQFSGQAQEVLYGKELFSESHLIKTISFSFENFSAWFGRGFAFTPGEIKKITLPNGLTMTLMVEAIRSPEPYIVLESLNGLKKDECKDIIRHIIRFFCLLSDEILTLKNVTVTTERKSSTTLEENLSSEYSFFWNDIHFATAVKNHHNGFPLHYQELEDDLQDILAEWFPLSKTCNIQLLRYFVLKKRPNEYYEGDLFIYASILEAFHRAITGKDICFRNRMKSLLNSILQTNTNMNEQLRSDILEKIPEYLKDTRNYEVHLDIGNKKRIAKGMKYWNLVFLAEKLFRLSFLVNLCSLKQNQKNELFHYSFFLSTIQDMLDVPSFDNSDLNNDKSDLKPSI